jgi:hypothetical protein
MRRWRETICKKLQSRALKNSPKIWTKSNEDGGFSGASRRIERFTTMRKRMSSGDGPGLQNRRAASSMSPVGSTPTRFRQFWVPSSARLRSGLRISARGSDPPQPAKTAPSGDPGTPRKRLNFKTGGRHLRCRRWVRPPLASATFWVPSSARLRQLQGMAARIDPRTQIAAPRRTQNGSGRRTTRPGELRNSSRTCSAGRAGPHVSEKRK